MKKLLVLFAVLFALFSGYWVFVNSKISEFVDDPAVIEQFGFVTTPNSKAWKGFPLKFSRRWSDVLYTLPAAESGHSWGIIDADDLTISAPSYYPMRYSFRHDGAAKFDIRTEQGDRYIFSSDDLNLTGRYQAKKGIGLKLLEIDIRDVAVDYFAMTPQIIQSADRISLSLNRDIETARIEFDIEDAVFYETILQDLGIILGTTVTKLDGDCDVQNPDALSGSPELLTPETRPAIRCDKVEIIWGSLDVIADINLRIDPNGPTGSLDLHIEETDTLAETITKAGRIYNTDVTKFQGMFRILEKDTDGRAKLPLTLKDGQPSFLGFTF